MDGEGKWSEVRIVPKDETEEEKKKRQEEHEEGCFPDYGPSCWGDDATDWM